MEANITIRNNVFLDTSRLFNIERNIFTEWFPIFLIGEHTIGDECWCNPLVHKSFGVNIIHHNPKLLEACHATN